MITLVLVLRHSIETALMKRIAHSQGLVHNHSYENDFNLHVNEISFSYEKMGTKTRFEEEAKGNSEMAYSNAQKLHVLRRIYNLNLALNGIFDTQPLFSGSGSLWH